MSTKLIRLHSLFRLLGAWLALTATADAQVAQVAPSRSRGDAIRTQACQALLSAIADPNNQKGLDPNFVRIGWQDNTQCLITYFESLKLDRAPTDAISQMVIATGTLRSIISNSASVAGDAMTVINFIRTSDSTGAVNNLAWAARANDYNLRYNASYILANIIDNGSACVIIDHLFDSAIADTQYGVNGRANLLGILRGVATWADPANRQHIRNVLAYQESIIAGKTDVADTRRLIEDIRGRLDNQLNAPSATHRDCQNYRPRFANPEWTAPAQR